ncbi:MULTISPECIES: cytochrome P450 [unclassified Cupriavidus]|uniref:cytochrome P450 n=1 Tax=unclassified Cupriavidus TaxID=2640874 RepID=UPI0010F4D2FE|nr:MULTISPECIES: cytochrome P450 [unclassified Cupriavidus]MWL89342.1 cytochrome P450 [Cupriavidus sp. SW-Y-13]
MNLQSFSSPAFFENPYPLYEQIRQAGPLLPLGPNVFVTGRHAVIDALLRDRRMGKTYLQSVQARYGEAATQQPVFQALSRTFLMMNPPAHTRLRALLMQAFNQRQVEAMRQIVAATTQRLLDRIGPQAEFDIVADFALPLPVEIICRMLDIPLEHGERLGAHAARLASALDLAPLDADQLALADEAALVLEAHFRDVVAQRRAHPGDDLISALVAAEEDGTTLSVDEIVSNVILLFVAGHETTSNMIGNTMIALFRNPDQLQRLRTDASLVRNAVVECMRHDGAVQMVVRTAMEDVEAGGAHVPRGSIVFMLLGAANRDPAVFADPDRLDIERDATAALGFGGGIHYCLGARLAMMEIEVAIRALLGRFPDLRPVDLEQLAWHRRNNLRGVQALKVRTAGR